MLCGSSGHQAKFRSLIGGVEEEEALRLIDLEMLLNTPVHVHTHNTYTNTHLSHIHTHALTKPGHKCQNSTTSNV